MIRQLLILVLLALSQQSLAMQPQVPTIQNRTIIVPTRGTNASPYATTRGQLGPVQGGVPPYIFNLVGHPGAPVGIENDQFWIAAFRVPISFQYTVTDDQGQTSAPATITLEPGANIQASTTDIPEAEPE